MAWAVEYRQFLYTIFLRDIPESVRKTLVDENAMKIWYNAVTHPSYDPLDNYRSLQVLGERIENLIYSLITYEEGGRFVNQRISIEDRVALADRLVINTYLRTFFTIGTHTKNDVISALIGAFYLNVKEEPINHCKILIESLFSLHIGIPAITQITDIINGLGWSRSKEFNIEELGKPNAIKQRGEIVGYEVQQQLPELAIDWLQRKGIIVRDPKLGYSRSIRKDEAIKTATEKSLIVLETLYDITSSTPLDELMASLPSETKSRLRSDDMKGIRFYRDPEGKRYQLLGIKVNNIEEILVTAIDRGVGSRKEAENALITYYTKQGKQQYGTLLSLSL